MLISVIVLSVVLGGILVNLLTASIFYFIVRNVGKDYPRDIIWGVVIMNLLPFVSFIFYLSILLKPRKPVDISELTKEAFDAKRNPKED